ncbi:M48 family metallopeptidase [Acetobacter sp.]|uniref:M48 family metallopeptidase n=1 Tax=Acetobacter sp. TaxID=440 RepID=UPI0025C64B08|nr:M48 family metallopeptidase [Acetobacter sp.]MCH4092138.1 M48 family metallopeptidase [Acetobacter sp.]MCI1299945.1 M48 family metallopeptidase [Acetobacter sp.]MCI1315963.1 M48 family metallopeptidase [Acetobacter sp.]
MLTARQFPDLYEQFTDCCGKLNISSPPKTYILHGNGVMNAFATRFLGTQYIVLLSDTVDAMSTNPDGIRFYLGHELGHLRMRHLGKTFLRWPALWLPLLGAAYSRARETTCDRHGRACCQSSENAARSLVALAAGSRRWQTTDLAEYCAQVQETSGFWMSFHELLAGYPWLSKRVARVMGQDASIPGRSKLAYLMALPLPYSGRGGFISVLLLFYMAFLVGTVAVTFYKEHRTGFLDRFARVETSSMVREAEPACQAAATFFKTRHVIPQSLESLGINATLQNGDRLSLDPDNMTITVAAHARALALAPRLMSDGSIVWRCKPVTGILASQLPASCSGPE